MKRVPNLRELDIGYCNLTSIAFVSKLPKLEVPQSKKKIPPAVYVLRPIVGPGWASMLATRAHMCATVVVEQTYIPGQRSMAL